MRTTPAGRFKAQCLELLDDVAQTGETTVVTKPGKPVAKVEPIEAPPPLKGSVVYLVDDDELIARERRGVPRGGRVIVLDTHVWLRWQTADEKLSDRAQTASARADRIGVSTISCYPVDRIIYATTLAHRAQLVTRDRELRRIDQGRTIW